MGYQSGTGRHASYPDPDTRLPVHPMRENPGVRFYFDQFGRISSRLQITAVPSIVRQMGDKIEITERAAL